MADHDLVIRGGIVCLGDRMINADVAVDDGLISRVEREIAGAGRNELDARALHVVAGGVDPHVHFNAPGRADWEGWESGSRALVAGGFTSCVEMPLNSSPVTTDPSAFDAKQAIAERTSLVDFALFGGLVPDNLSELPALAARGAAGFKAFLCDSGLAEFPPVDDLTLAEGMRCCADLDSIVLVHAENHATVTGLERRARSAGVLNARAYSASRPIVAELEAISRALFWAAETRCRLHIVHVTTARGIRLVQEARKAGVDATCETCPHYLLLDDSDFERVGSAAKCAPPLRPAVERRRLWEAFEAGYVDLIASDHSPCPQEMKEKDLFDAWGGVAGCQTTRQLIWAEGLRFGIDLPRLVELTGSSAASRFRLPTKGRIEIGADADLCLVDLSAEWKLRASDLFYRHRTSPFVGRRLRGRIVCALLRGKAIFQNGEFAGLPFGRLLRPARSSRVGSHSGLPYPKLA